MTFRRYNHPSIPGDYQYTSVTHGFKCQQAWHKYKRLIIDKYVRYTLFKRICDIGCGSATVASYVAEISPNSMVVGLDVNPECIKFGAHQYGRIPNLTLYTQDIMSPSINTLGTFDFIYCFEVIEHFSYSTCCKFLKSIRQLGNDSTVYLLTTPDYATLWPFIEIILDILPFSPKLSKHQHFTKFNKRRLYDMIKTNGFSVYRMFNICGLSPLIAQFSGRLSKLVENKERDSETGFLICCEFRKVHR